ncbi:OmpP1/FadL family transporter [Salinicola sp. V024]|uniref:OmpP1/FadL family transporter n=1 Tax=Salinicola sp. V024 TaxID=3459609 RepID=UPI0040445302
MTYRYNRLSLAIALIGAAASGQAMAGAFQLNEQSVSAQGTSDAGRASNVMDATVVYGNPAGMSFIDRAQVSAGVHYLDASSNVRDSTGTTAYGTPISGDDGDDMVPGKAIPFGFYVQPISDRWSFGFGVYAPFGLITDYDDDYKGRYYGNYSDVEVITAQPTLSYRFNDRFAIGFGVTYNHIKGELENKTPGTAGDGTVNVKGDDDAWGYVAGIIYRPVASTTLGLAYRSKVDYDLDGDVKFSDVASLPVSYLKADASLSITLPETVEFSITHALDDRWKIMAGMTYVRWSRFEELNVENDVTAIGEQQNYKDAWQYAVGMSYQASPEWLLRTGLALDKSPIRDSDRTVRVPSSDRTLFSVGAGWTPTPNLTLDVAYTRLWEDSAPLEQGEVGDPSEPRGRYTADYDNNANIFGAQLTYRF